MGNLCAGGVRDIEQNEKANNADKGDDTLPAGHPDLSLAVTSSSERAAKPTDFNIEEGDLIQLLDFLEEVLMEEKDKLKQATYRDQMENQTEQCVNFTFEGYAKEGKIIVAEVVDEMKALLNVTEEEGLELLAVFDNNQDGIITEDEFKRFVEDEASTKYEWVRNYHSSQDWVNNYCNKIMEGHEPVTGRRPLALVSYGPQGSGKTSSTNDYLKSINADPVIVDIDAMTRLYASEFLKDDKICETPEGYFKVRNGWPSIGKTELIQRCADKKLDILMETTGRRLKTWRRCQKLIKEHNYKTIVIYVLVPYIELIQRILSRHKKNGQAYEHFAMLCRQVKDCASNSRKWFDNADDGGFVYFNNNLGFGNQKQIKSEEELQEMLHKLPFMKHVEQTVQWRPVEVKRQPDRKERALEPKKTEAGQTSPYQKNRHPVE